jgi:predicted RNase H-like HicB family nuclease
MSSYRIDPVPFWTDKRSMNYFTVSTAKPKLGRLLDNVLKSGIPLVLRRGDRFLQISEYVVPHPTARVAHESLAVAEPLSRYGEAKQLHFRTNLFESDEGWAVSCPDLPGCHSQGKTRKEALTNIKEAIRLWLEVEAEDTGLRRVEHADVLVYPQ